MANKLFLSGKRLVRQSFIFTSILLPSLTSAFSSSAVALSRYSHLNSLTCPSSSGVPRIMMSSSRAESDSSGLEEKSYIDKLALILVNSENKQLVARSRGKSVFFTPGGKREPNETDEEALIRECKEELSVSLTSFSKSPTKIEPYGTFEAQAFGKAPGTMVRMTCFRLTPRDAEIELEDLVKASDEVEELKWIDSTFDREKLTVTGIMILEDLKSRELID